MSLAAKKILIVEDETPLRTALADVFSHKNCTVLVAANGKDGLELALSEKPDIVLLDLIMPIMTGTEMMQELRKDAWGAQVPIIILTNLSANTPDQVRSMLEGAPELYLIKSDWDIHDIEKKVEEVLHYT
jgi:two-component system response regulator AdeR